MSSPCLYYHSILYFLWGNHKYKGALRSYPWQNLYITFLGNCPPTPSPNPTFCFKWKVSVNVGLGEGLVGSLPETHNDPIFLQGLEPILTGDKVTFGDGTTLNDVIIRSGYSSRIFEISRVPMPAPVPPPRECVSWKPCRQSQPSVSLRTTSSTESTSSAPSV